MSRLPAAIVLAICLGAVAVALGGAGPSSEAALREADRLYAERSYAKAVDLYQRALDAGVAGRRAAEVEYRIAVCLGRSQRWDDAFARTRQFIEAHPEGVWGARGNYWLGELFAAAIHCGYRVGDRLYRGENYPTLETAEEPEQVCLCSSDIDDAIAAFERAKRLYENLRPRREREEADLNFDLARVLAGRDLLPLAAGLFALAREKHPGLVDRYPNVSADQVQKLRNHDWTPTPEKPFDPEQPSPQQVLSLYEQIEQLDSGRRAPEARFARAVFLGQYQVRMADLMRGYDQRTGDWTHLPFPYQDIDPIALLESIGNDFPKSAVAPQAQLLAGQLLERKGEFVKALEAYRCLIERWPDSKWVSDARDQIQDIQWSSMELRTRVAAAGHKPTVQLHARNVKTVSFSPYRVRLEPSSR